VGGGPARRSEGVACTWDRAHGDLEEVFHGEELRRGGVGGSGENHGRGRHGDGATQHTRPTVGAPRPARVTSKR